MLVVEAPKAGEGIAFELSLPGSDDNYFHHSALQYPHPLQKSLEIGTGWLEREEQNGMDKYYACCGLLVSSVTPRGAQSSNCGCSQKRAPPESASTYHAESWPKGMPLLSTQHQPTPHRDEYASLATTIALASHQVPTAL